MCACTCTCAAVPIEPATIRISGTLKLSSVQVVGTNKPCYVLCHICLVYHIRNVSQRQRTDNHTSHRCCTVTNPKAVEMSPPQHWCR